MRLFSGFAACARREVSVHHVDVLDGIRALAIFIVAWFHIWQQSWLWPTLYLEKSGTMLLNLSPLVSAGYIMVDVMLLISGFLLFLPYARYMWARDHGELGPGSRLPGIKEFYVKRALRILPSYWLSIFVVLFFFALPRREFYTTESMWRDIFSHLTFTNVFYYDAYMGTKLNVALWTLAIEVQFYVIFPWIARLFVKKPLACWGLLTAAGLAFRYFVVLKQPDTNMWVNQLPTFLDVYANGMLAAVFYVNFAKAIRHNRWTRLCFSAFSMVMVAVIWQIIQRQATAQGGEMIRLYQTQNRFFLSVCVCAFILFSANAGATVRYVLSNKTVRVASAISLQYYIWHQYIADQLHNWWHFPPSISPMPHEAMEKTWQWQFTLCAFGIPLILALLLTYGFEQPIARAGLRAWKRRRTPGEGLTMTNGGEGS